MLFTFLESEKYALGRIKNLITSFNQNVWKQYVEQLSWEFLYKFDEPFQIPNAYLRSNLVGPIRMVVIYAPLWMRAVFLSGGAGIKPDSSPHKLVMAHRAVFLSGGAG